MIVLPVYNVEIAVHLVHENSCQVVGVPADNTGGVDYMAITRNKTRCIIFFVVHFAQCSAVENFCCSQSFSSAVSDPTAAR